MTSKPNRGTGYWGTMTPPKTRAEFFNAVTAPSPTGEGRVATIRIYGPIDSYGGWWGINTKEVGAVLDALPDSVEQIVLRINSPGGEVFEGVAILNMFRAHKAKVTAVVDGLAASAASVIAAGCDETVMSPGTQMMIHKPSVIMWGDADGLRHEAGVLDTIEESIIDVYRQKAGEKDWAQLLSNETWYTADEAVTAGLADRKGIVPDAGDAETVGAEPIDVGDDDEGDIEDLIILRPAARGGRRVASKLPDSTEPGDPNQKEELIVSDTIKAGLRERLGVTDAELSDEELLEALDEVLEEQADTTTTETAAATLPEGFVAIDETVLNQLKSNAQRGADARAEQDKTRRDGIVATALREGRISSASKDAIRAQLEKDEAGTVAFIETLPKNTATPVDEIGHADDVTSADDALYASAWGSTEKEA